MSTWEDLGFPSLYGLGYDPTYRQMSSVSYLGVYIIETYETNGISFNQVNGCLVEVEDVTLDTSQRLNPATYTDLTTKLNGDDAAFELSLAQDQAILKREQERRVAVLIKYSLE